MEMRAAAVSALRAEGAANNQSFCPSALPVKISLAQGGAPLAIHFSMAAMISGLTQPSSPSWLHLP
jgi:hypothetical protein